MLCFYTTTTNRMWTRRKQMMLDCGWQWVQTNNVRRTLQGQVTVYSLFIASITAKVSIYWCCCSFHCWDCHYCYCYGYCYHLYCRRSCTYCYCRYCAATGTTTFVGIDGIPIATVYLLLLLFSMLMLVLPLLLFLIVFAVVVHFVMATRW